MVSVVEKLVGDCLPAFRDAESRRLLSPDRIYCSPIGGGVR